MSRRSVLLLTIFLLGSANLVAQTSPQRPAAAESYGPGGQELYIGAPAFRLQDNGGFLLDPPEQYVTWDDGYLAATCCQFYSSDFGAPVTLPAGAQITALCLYAFDQTTSRSVRAQLWASKLVPAGASPGGVRIGPELSTFWNFGHGVVCADIVPPYTYRESGDVDGDGFDEHVTHHIFAHLGFPVGPFGDDAENLRLGGVGVFWRRQVSPAPTVATFADAPTSHPFFQHIEALAASGITEGCGGGNFCPNSVLTRGQMAVFLARALGLHWPY